MPADNDARDDIPPESPDAPALPPVGALEAILFVADKPVTVYALAAALSLPIPVIHDALESLAATLSERESALELREVGGGWRLYVRSAFDPAIVAFLGEETIPKLSQAALETLAVIAYKQPISRGQIAAVRAVNVDSVVRTLISRGLVQEAYTDTETGAVMFEVTPLVLAKLGLNSLDELPKISPLLPDAEDVFDDAR